MLQDSMPVRPLWLRFLQFPLTRIILLGGTIFYLMAVNNGFLEQFKGDPVLALAITAGMGLVAIAIYVGYGTFIERREVSELSLPGMGREWAIGASIGAGLFSACVLILFILGIYRVEGLNPWTFLIPGVAMALSAGLFEELVFRGVLFRSVEDLFGSWISVAVSSFVFGAVHLFNPEATLAGAIYVGIEAGLLLAAAYLVTRRLWLSIGAHMAWNYSESAIFSSVVSGSINDPGLIRSSIEGPELLTGGSFGLELSVFALVLCTSAGLIMMIIAARRGHIVPPPWKR
jgi:membrane protease YdiL (CAAX protease family)